MGKAAAEPRLSQSELQAAAALHHQANAPSQSAEYSDLPRLPPAPSSPVSKRRPSGLPPKLGIKKRKPRASSVISAANQRVRAAASQGSSQGVESVPSNTLEATPVETPASSRTESRTPRYKNGISETESKRKGLRHFAVRVSRKVEQKVVTTYNEVADELVAEETMLRKNELASGGAAAASLQKKLEKGGALVDEKNIRRRVYDSLNVLMAMGIIEKEKKLISWRGLDHAHSARGNGEMAMLKAAITEKKRVLEEKTRFLHGVQDQYSRTSAIIERNKATARMSGMMQDVMMEPDPRLPVHHYYPDRIGLPFVIFSSPRDTSIELEMDKSREEISFTFSSTFQIFDDREILRRMILQPEDDSYNPVTELERLSRQLIASPGPSQRR